jgi:hypothetical protein
LKTIVRAFVLQRIVQVNAGPLGVEIVGAESAAKPEVSIGDFRIDSEAFRRAIGAARADASVTFPAAA